KQPVMIEAGDRVLSVPVDVPSAVQFKNDNPGTVIVSGGTDICVQCNKRGIEPPRIMSLSNIPDLDEIRLEGKDVIVGARATLTALEQFYAERVPDMYEILRVFGSPQIKNAGT